jgi:transcriptional regulator with XRE-family HTH domain
MKTAERPVGELLKEWRQRRRLSQLDFSLEADVSSRHLSFIETGRSQPSREMLLHLAERLDVPLRERNVLLITAGYAPVFPERALEDPALFPAKQAIGLVLKSHEPYPALAIDRHWQIVAHNDAVLPLLTGIPERLLTPPINVLRLSLHPEGLASRIENLGEWRDHLMERLRRQIAATADKVLIELQAELETFPAPEATAPSAYAGMVVPLRLRTPNGVLSMFSTTMIFGTPQDVTLAELAIESFFPADEATAEAFSPQMR